MQFRKKNNYVLRLALGIFEKNLIFCNGNGKYVQQICKASMKL